MANPQQTVGAVVGLLAMLLIGVLLLGMVAGIAPQFLDGSATTANQTDDVPVLSGSGTISAGSATIGNVSSVVTSLDDAVQLSGADDSNVTIDSDADLGHDFSVCTFAAANNSVVTSDETRLLLSTQSAILWYNGTDDVWRGYYYNTSSLNSYRAEVAASSPSSPTLVCLNHATQSLNISANTTTGSAVATGSPNTAAYPSNVSNWHGTVEETRLYATPLNGSQRTEWVADPVLAVGGATPDARVTYDTRASSIPSSFTAYFGSGTATASNASLTTGRAGPTIAESTDYSVSGDTITVLSGGALDDDGEVLYVEYGVSASEWSTTFASVSEQARSTFSLLNLIPFLLVAVLIIAMIRL